MFPHRCPSSTSNPASEKQLIICPHISASLSINDIFRLLVTRSRKPWPSLRSHLYPTIFSEAKTFCFSMSISYSLLSFALPVLSVRSSSCLGPLYTSSLTHSLGSSQSFNQSCHYSIICPRSTCFKSIHFPHYLWSKGSALLPALAQISSIPPQFNSLPLISTDSAKQTLPHSPNMFCPCYLYLLSQMQSHPQPWFILQGLLSFLIYN